MGLKQLLVMWLLLIDESLGVTNENSKGKDVVCFSDPVWFDEACLTRKDIGNGSTEIVGGIYVHFNMCQYIERSPNSNKCSTHPRF